jgi:hypothetical protein
MSGYRRFCVAAFLILAGLLTAPVFSNPITDLLSPAPKQETAPAPAPAPVREACLHQPGKPTPGQHWFYRLDDHRKCWYQADEATVSSRRQLRHHAASRPAVVRQSDREDEEAELRKKTVRDARAQVLAAQADARQSVALAPEVADAAPAPAQDPVVPVVPVPAAPVVAQVVDKVVAQPAFDPRAFDAHTVDRHTIDQSAVDQHTPDRAAPRSTEVAMLLTTPSLAQQPAASSVPPAPSRALAAADADHWQLMTVRIGRMLIALGLVLLGGSLLAGRFLDARVPRLR